MVYIYIYTYIELGSMVDQASNKGDSTDVV